MLITDGKERILKNQQKKSLLLRFLKQHTYTDTTILAELLNLKSRHGLYRLLPKLESEGLIIKYTHQLTPTQSINLWGITNDGLAEAYTKKDTYLLPYFEPSTLNWSTLPHHLDNQNVHIVLSKKGCTDYINGDRSGFFNLFKDVKHRPDAVLTLPNGKRIAIETERSIKTKARYKEIMKSHLIARKNEHWFYVIYVMPTERKKESLIKIFNAITFVNFFGKPTPIEAKHRKVFRFYTVEELKRLNLNHMS